MSTIVVLTPIIVANWPAITAAVAGAAAGLGYSLAEGTEESGVRETQATTAEVELKDSEVVGAQLSAQGEIVVRRGGVVLRLCRDERGQCKVCATGEGKSKADLQNAAEEFANRMTQSFVYSKIRSELRSHGLQVVDEDTLEDESIRIHVRHWTE